MQLEAFFESEGSEAIEQFIQDAMNTAASQEKASWQNKLAALRTEFQQSLDGVSVEGAPDGVLMNFSGSGGDKRLKIIFDSDEKRIADLVQLALPKPMQIDLENLSATIDTLAMKGMSGVISLKIKGKMILERPFGMANRSLDQANQLSSVFGTGSRPIDYTIAAIQLLDQEGKLSLEDPISKYFHMAPADKKDISIQQLMTGGSGLPDFFDTPDDWDPDLAWVDRETAIQRMFKQSLLFEPGTEEEHSHGAFGILAALVEMISGESYYAFLRKHFFDPAGMQHTGEYGETRGLAFTDFAEGGGPSKIGTPNIPPNWGPTSWLIKGSGGMYSTLGDLKKFYQFIRSGTVLDETHQKVFRQRTVNLDGSDRGFELLSAYYPPDTELWFFLNETGDRSQLRPLFRALIALLPKE